MSDDAYNLLDEYSSSSPIMFSKVFKEQLYIITNSKQLMIFDFSSKKINLIQTLNLQVHVSSFCVNDDYIAFSTWGSKEINILSKYELTPIGKIGVGVHGIKSL
jgi:hypothetical protein